MNKLFLLLVLICTLPINAMQKDKAELIKKYEEQAVCEWHPATIAFMKDPKNAENKDAKMLKRYIEIVGETKEHYQQRYSMPEQQAIEQALKQAPVDNYDLNYIKNGSKCGNDGLCNCREEWKEIFDPLEAEILKRSTN